MFLYCNSSNFAQHLLESGECAKLHNLLSYEVGMRIGSVFYQNLRNGKIAQHSHTGGKQLARDRSPR